jgi:hypothetical protein
MKNSQIDIVTKAVRRAGQAAVEKAIAMGTKIAVIKDGRAVEVAPHHTVKKGKK